MPEADGGVANSVHKGNWWIAAVMHGLPLNGFELCGPFTHGFLQSPALQSCEVG